MIKNVKFPGYYSYMNLNIWGDFQFCICVPLNEPKGSFTQFSLNKKNQLLGLMLDLLWSFFKSELMQLDICCCKNNFFLSPI